MNEGTDIDKLLVVTFTNAAASEMRERVLDAIYQKLDEYPDDENLQKQIVLLGKSNICTIHSFCLDVIKNNFFEIDLPASFRIASEEEIALLKQEVLDDVFEELYDSEDKSFCKLVECYTGYRGDEPIQELVYNTYRVIQSMPFPEKWLYEKVELFNKEKYDYKDFGETLWGKILLENLKEEIFDSINNLKSVKRNVDKHIEMEKYSIILQNDIDMLQELLDSSNVWDYCYECANNIKFKTWPADKKVSQELKDEAKKSRDSVKKKVNSAIEKTLLYNSESAFNDAYLVYENLVSLRDLILEFDKKFKEKKKAKNIIDFSDIEHYALSILAKEDENGNYVPTEVAKMYQQKFDEIAIDEYQDSNQIQEYILKSVSRGNNIFMVGDVKQSIYKFRQACPELFLEKYENYDLKGNDNGLKIQLFKNFRSNENILDITNNIFQLIMSKELGDIDYTEEEFLNLGADYPQIEGGVGKSELHIIDILDDTEEDEIIDEETQDESYKNFDKIEIEAKFVTNKIKELVGSGQKVKLKNGEYKNIEYRDIVILLRSTATSAPIFERELVKNDIPVFSDSTSEYLETMEVQTVINLLKVLDNPLDDINMISVMRSKIGGFTDNEILEIRLINRDESVFSNLIEARNIDKFSKVQEFLNNIENWKKESDYLTLAELIWKIYIDTGFLNYVGLMTNGNIRQANLIMLFERAKDYEKTSFSGLFDFIRFMEKLRTSNSDMSAAKVIGESENVVRIMSIHKSKGLEFPVVFLCCTNKQINLQDLKNSILIHKDIGFGPEYVDYQRKIQYPTAAKQAIKIISKNESISEEMRILYVALTRAKEKLIITATTNDYTKQVDKMKENLQIYEEDNFKINPILLKKYISYLDWILLVYFKQRLDDSIDLMVHNKNEVKNEESIDEILLEFDFNQKLDSQKFADIFNWKYDDFSLVNTPIKTTVSQIKSLQNQTDIENKIGLEEIKAKFLNSRNEITAAQKGTLMHLLLQKIDFKNTFTKQDVQSVIQKLESSQIISHEEAIIIDIQKIVNFLESDICNRIRNAKIVEKEKAFCINLNLEEYEMNEVSVQGIIDLYFIDENDKLVLLDYKTDFVNNEEILKKRYKVQLEIYGKALETSLNRAVDDVYIYSTHLNKLINL